MGEWKETTLAQVCAESSGGIQTGPFGSQLHAQDYVPKGIPVVMPQDIADNRIDSVAIARISVKDRDRLLKYALCAGDIVYSRRGDVGRRALVRADNEGWLCGTGCLRVRVSDQRVHDSTFLSYLLGTEEARAWIVRHAVGATMLNLNTSILGRLPLRIPGVSTQRAIAEVLGALDDKIAANEQIRTTLAALSIALVERHAEGTRQVRLDEVTLGISRGVAPQYVEQGGTLVINQKCVRNGHVDTTTARRTSRMPAADRLLRRDDLLVNSTGQGTLGRVGRWVWPNLSATTDSHVTIVRFDPLLVNPTYAGVLSLSRQREIESLAEGSTGQTELRRGLLGAVRLTVPPLDLQCLVGAQLRGLDDRSRTAWIESRALAATRDELLPLLMSGRLRVKDAEKVVAEVV